MKRGLKIAALVAALIVAWLALGRQLTLLVDNFATEGEAKPTTGPFAASADSMHVGETPLELTRPDGERDTVRVSADESGRVTLEAGGKSFPLGTRSAEAEIATIGPYDISFAPDPDDVVTFRMAHSTVPWPTPLELNFITGKSPSWKRNVYYTLTWRKADGKELELTWRYQQWHYDDWASPQMISAGATGLISSTIRDEAARP